MQAYEALSLMEKLAAVAVILQTIELFQLRVAATQVWSGSILRRDYAATSPLVRKVADALLSDEGFFWILAFRLIAGVVLLAFPSWNALLVLLIGSLLISIRWRGTFNGGSDAMTLIVVGALFLARSFPGSPAVWLGCLWYVAIQTGLSYFIAGAAKLRNPSWRSGQALPTLLGSSVYATPAVVPVGVARFASRSVLAFECAFPLAFLHPRICLAFLTVGFCFHLTNVVLLGLNRFFWIWLATYPAVYFCSQLLA